MKCTTTLSRIRACSPSQSGWHKLLNYLGPDFDPETEINLLTILDLNGVADMLWALRATVQDSTRCASQLAIEFAAEVLPLFEKRRPGDDRPRKAIQAARDFLDGKISEGELRQAHQDAYAAATAAASAAT